MTTTTESFPMQKADLDHALGERRSLWHDCRLDWRETLEALTLNTHVDVPGTRHEYLSHDLSKPNAPLPLPLGLTRLKNSSRDLVGPLPAKLTIVQFWGSSHSRSDSVVDVIIEI